MRIVNQMKLAVTVNRGRVAPVFPGVDLRLIEEQDATSSSREDVMTSSWPLPAWSAQLMRRDVGVLLCAGIDSFVWGALQGHGIAVVPDAIGLPDEIIKQWRNGTLTVPQTWPPQTQGACCRGLRRRKGRRGGK